MKKKLALIIAIVLVLSLAACGSSSQTSENDSSETTVSGRPDGTPPEMPNGGTPPDKPNGNGGPGGNAVGCDGKPSGGIGKGCFFRCGRGGFAGVFRV